MPPNEKPPGAAQLTVESLADTVRLLFDWLAPEPSAQPQPPKPAAGDIETEGEPVE